MNGGDQSEAKDPAIKLFGMTIPVPECHIPAKADEKTDAGYQIPVHCDLMEVCHGMIKTEAEVVHFEMPIEQDKFSVVKEGKDENSQITGDGEEGQVNLKPNEDLLDTSSVDQEKVLKKPDKVLPCPRCNSLDTKFCYFNNYNVNQSRHFCKNCHRYWTAGGTMRNVPVGAGRRKHKHLSSHYRHMLVSPEPASRIDTSDSVNQQGFSSSESPSTLRSSTSNETVLKLGPEGGLCESMATALHLRKQKSCTSELGSAREIREEPSSCGSSITASIVVQENEMPEKVTKQSSLPGSCNELTLPDPWHYYYPVPPLFLACNQILNNRAPMVTVRCSSGLVSVPVSNANPIQLFSTPMVAVPGFCTPNIPLQFVPPSYSGCLPVWTAGTTNTPMVGPDSGYSPSSSTSNVYSSNNSPTLGKHSREVNSMDEEKSEKCVLVPKTLRIDDPDDASQSSFWAALGVNSGKKETESRCSSFKPFKSSAEFMGHSLDATRVLEANPAALSRSHSFREST